MSLNSFEFQIRQNVQQNPPNISFNGNKTSNQIKAHLSLYLYVMFIIYFGFI